MTVTLCSIFHRKFDKSEKFTFAVKLFPHQVKWSEVFYVEHDDDDVKLLSFIKNVETAFKGLRKALFEFNVWRHRRISPGQSTLYWKNKLQSCKHLSLWKKKLQQHSQLWDVCQSYLSCYSWQTPSVLFGACQDRSVHLAANFIW